MHPPPSHIRIPEEPASNDPIPFCPERIEVEQRLSHGKIPPQNDDISEQRVHHHIHRRERPIKMHNRKMGHDNSADDGKETVHNIRQRRCPAKTKKKRDNGKINDPYDKRYKVGGVLIQRMDFHVQQPAAERHEEQAGHQGTAYQGFLVHLDLPCYKYISARFLCLSSEFPML